MKIFIGWSGRVSKKIGENFYNWLPKFDENIDVFFSPKITKGRRSEQEIAEELYNSNFGIFCFTETNVNSLWISFEAGAISKNIMDYRVCPVLYKIDEEGLKPPISSFHGTKIKDEDDMLILVRDIFKALWDNKELNEDDEKLIKDKFNDLWLEFKKALEKYEESDKFHIDIHRDLSEKLSNLNNIKSNLGTIQKRYYDSPNFQEKIGREVLKEMGRYKPEIENKKSKIPDKNWLDIKEMVYKREHVPMCSFCSKNVLPEEYKPWYCDNCRNFYHDKCKDDIPKHSCEECNEPLKPIRRYIEHPIIYHSTISLN